MTSFALGVAATRKGLETITRFSFVDEPEPGRYALHALVREALADQNDPDERRAVHQHLFDWADTQLADVDPLAITEAQLQALREGVIHGQEVQPPEEELRWYRQAERPFDWAADWRTLLPLRQAITSFAQRTLGPNHPDTLNSLNNLAMLLSDRGDYDAAEPLCRRALDASERTLGPDHPTTLTSLNNFARLLIRRGDYDAAEPLCRRALDVRRRTLGPDHPDTLISIYDLARLLTRRGDYDAAEPLCRRALEGAVRQLGREHPYTRAFQQYLDTLLEDISRASGGE